MDHERRQDLSQEGSRPGGPDHAPTNRPGGEERPKPAPSGAGPTSDDLEQQARELERRAVDADAAVARAIDGRSAVAGSNPAASVSSSELRRLRSEADLLMDRALAARLEADRAALAARSVEADTTVPVTNWNRREWSWDRLLAAALDEPPAGDPATSSDDVAPPNGRYDQHGSEGHDDEATGVPSGSPSPGAEASAAGDPSPSDSSG